jgi:hypothetical protein
LRVKPVWLADLVILLGGNGFDGLDLADTDIQCTRG